MPLTIVILVGAVRRAAPRHREGRGVFRPDHGRLVHRRSRWSGCCTSATIRSVFAAINPYYAVTLLARSHGLIGLVTLGAVFLAVTGGEALYADLGHFGRKPIQTAWFGLVLPALAASTISGRARWCLRDPAAIANPFYRLVPEMLLLPMVVLATCATVIASQAVITGAYSLTYQAIQLGLLPRLAILHTSAAHFGQIYIPRVNTMLLVGVLLLVLMFRTSSKLAHAYGIAVTTTMVVDGILGFIVIWKLWKWKWWSAALLIVPLVFIDATFLSANLLKLLEGAWVPVLFGACMVLLIITWQRGTPHPRSEDAPGRGADRCADPQPGKEAAAHRAGHGGVPHQRSGFRAGLAAAQSQAQQGAARAQHHPHHRDRRHAAHRSRTSACEITPISERFTRVALRFGFMEEPNVPKALALARKQGLHFDIMSTSFFLSRRSLKASAHSGMPAGRTGCSSGLRARPTTRPTSSRYPTGRVVEVGTQVAV